MVETFLSSGKSSGTCTAKRDDSQRLGSIDCRDSRHQKLAMSGFPVKIIQTTETHSAFIERIDYHEISLASPIRLASASSSSISLATLP